MRLTPRELVLLSEGERVRDERALERLAACTVALMRTQGSKITLDEFLGRPTLSVQDKYRLTMRAQYEREGKDPDLVDRMLLSPGQQLEAIAEGRWPALEN